MRSCIYEGVVRHRRFQPIRREFKYRITFVYLDLGELDQQLDRLWLLGRGRFAPAAIRREDHLQPEVPSLDEAVRQTVEAETGSRPVGRIGLLTQWRTFGFYFSPINLYYCFDDDDRVDAIVAEVSNTPWGEKHSYVLWSGNQTSQRSLAYRHPKDFHVSPFMDMGLEYDWRLVGPEQRTAIHLQVLREGHAAFDATTQLRRRELTNRTWLSTVCRNPIPAARVLVAIYYEALRLWLKKCPFFPHPDKQPSIKTSTESTEVMSKVG